MIGLLQQIVDSFVCWVETAVMTVVNLIIYGVGAAIAALIAAWPIAMPTMPDLPTGVTTALAWVKWSPIPVQAGIDFLVFSVGVWAAWLLIQIPLRWLKVIE